MDVKRRSSEDDAGVGPSTLRRLIQPSRMSARRSSGSWSSSASSIVSHDHDDQTSCVTRDSSHDECALNRFMVWAAIKRNASSKMTPEERLVCPLLRCHQRFPTHELMLQHLYVCPELATAEYWCYDCDRKERFSDAKCRRCLGHPSRRRRIMFMAKNFFSSIGHRSRTGSLPDLDIDSDDAPPSYHDALTVIDTSAPLRAAELQANEIHEIDSSEVLPTIIEEAAVPPPIPPRPSRLAHAISPPPVFFPEQPPRSVYAVELESARRDISPQAPPLTVAPASLNAFPGDVYQDHIMNGSRPNLQVQTMDLAQFRSQAKRRSKNLAPSSSVRSTTSTNSTDSTNSSASYAVSTVSSYSGGWGRASTFDSALTTPADEFIPADPFSLCSRPGDSLSAPTSNPFSPHSYNQLSEDHHQPPATAMPTFTETVPPPDPIDASSLQWFQPSYPFETSVVPDLHVEPTLPAATKDPWPRSQTPDLDQTSTDTHSVGAHSLARTAWDTLKMHVSASMDRLRNVTDNQLIEQLRAMSPESVCRVGLKTMVGIRARETVTSSVDLLCFIHLIYSLSLVIHEQDAPSRGTGLFSQAVAYSSWLTQQDRRAYLPVVGALWKPSSMSDDDATGLMRRASAASRSRGKQPQSVVSEPTSDPLALVAQFFLDELEFSALCETARSDIQTSELCVQHMKDTTLEPAKNSPVGMATDLLFDSLSRLYAGRPAYLAKLGELRSRVDPSHCLITRRLELELMNVGKMSLPPDMYFDTYVPGVRAGVDPLYSLTSPEATDRSTYHGLGAKLMEQLMAPTPPKSTPESNLILPQAVTGDVSPADGVEDTLMPQVPQDFDIDSLLRFDSTPYDEDAAVGVAASIGGDTHDFFSESPTTAESKLGSSTAATSPPSQETTPSAGGSRVVESSPRCDICGYRPEGDPRWFTGSMAKHKKTKHAANPPAVYACPFPGCTSKFTSRPDNLRQHQLKKRHFVDDEDATGRRPSKKRKNGVV